MQKKILSSFILLSFLFLNPLIAFGYEIADCDIEHLNTGLKNQKIDLVKVKSDGIVLQKENCLVVNFAQNFNSKYYKTGDYVQFNFEQDLKTKEGTIIIPCNSQLIARISCIEKPKVFSRNAKVYLEFTHILLPDASSIPVYLTIYGRKNYLQEGAKETTGKILGYTLAIGGFGSGLGAAIGVAAGHTITGLIIGGSIGGGVGLLTGIISPGLHFRAKKGEKLIIELTDNIKLPD